MTATAHRSLPGIDLLAPAWESGVPYDQFERLRREAPVYWHHETDGGPGFWAITKHEDVRQCSLDWRTFSSERGTIFIPTQEEEALGRLRLTIINMDPPRHDRYRRLVSKAFTPRRIGMLAEEIERRAVAVIDGICGQREVEFAGEVAAQVPIQTICQMIGLEPGQWQRMFELSNALSAGLGRGGSDAAGIEIYLLCDQVAADRRARPRDDLMTALVNAQVDGERLANDEIVVFFMTLLVAGNETTRNLISHSVLALLDHPEQARRLRADPSLWDVAIEEMLRWGTPIYGFRRTATRDTELRGVPISEGDKIVLYYASANRDEDVFARPRAFDITRTPNDHLTFGGGGPHFCLGASLARAEIKATMRQVVERLPDLHLTGTPVRVRSDLVNGIERMPARFTPS
jgi:cholest-4-en-3-one 26-monooxygenase